MAKRSRLTAKPGQRRPLQRATPRTSEAAPPAGSVTAEEEARAAELEAAIVAEEKAARRRVAVAPVPPAAISARRAGVGPRRLSYTSVPLSVRAADEYAYVKRDIRRIAIVGGLLIAILAVLEVLVNGMHLFALVGARRLAPCQPFDPGPAARSPSPCSSRRPERQPLAARMRPRTPGRVRRAGASRRRARAAPPGARRAAISARSSCGARPAPARRRLARLLADAIGADMVALSAVSSGVADVRARSPRPRTGSR